MEKFIRWLNELMRRYRVWRLGHDLTRLERRLTNTDQWVVSFELCHMILTTIPRDMLLNIPRNVEFECAINLSVKMLDDYINCMDIMINCMQKTIDYRKGVDGVTGTGYIMLERHLVDATTVDFSIGMLLVDSEEIKTTVQLYDYLLKTTGRILKMERSYLKESDHSYIDRRGGRFVDDLFVLSTALARLAMTGSGRTDEGLFT